MRQSIGNRILLFVSLLILLVNGIVALGIRFVLPVYYTDYQLDKIIGYTDAITAEYDRASEEELVQAVYALQSQMGGDVYWVTEQGSMHGNGMGRMQRNSSFELDGNYTHYRYVNKLGIEVYTFGMRLGDETLVYEVSIQSLKDAAGVMSRFMWMPLAASLLVGLFMATVLSRRLTSPIKALNTLAKDMQKKTAQPARVTPHRDELGELNASLNVLYTELLDNIVMLERELERTKALESRKKRFLAQATHELKTPMAIIKGYTELIYDGMYRDEAERESYVAKLYEETQQTTVLLQELLDYARFEETQGKVSLERLDLVALVRDNAKPYERLCAQKGVSFEFETSEAELFCDVDGFRMAQVLKNLLNNALEFAVSQIVVSVSATGEWVQFSVYNDGTPIPASDLPNLFDSFYKGAGKMTGTGLGLAIAKDIVEKHGGALSVKNVADGVGFHVKLKQHSL